MGCLTGEEGWSNPQIAVNEVDRRGDSRPAKRGGQIPKIVVKDHQSEQWSTEQPRIGGASVSREEEKGVNRDSGRKSQLRERKI